VSELALVELKAALDKWASNPDAWRALTRHDQEERVYELLYRDDDVEIYLVCWMPGHDTGFHDHDDSAAAITVVDGAIVEERLAITGAVKHTLSNGDTVTIAREAIHRVRHVGQSPATTLHAYSPPLQRVGTYEVADDGALLRHPRPAETPLEAAA
jgi:quercetin dioxygenase-like cupin family protein